MPIFAPLEESGFSTLHEDIIHSRTRDIEKPAQAENITIGVRVFHDDVHSVVRDNPSLMADTPTTARLGFPDVVFPDDQRNDVYIKLWDGSFPSLAQGGSKLVRGASNNIEVEVEVRNREGSTLGYCISRGAGLANVSRYTSAVFRNSTAPSQFHHMHINLLLLLTLLSMN
jgi:dedicator of cytokinesis protein 3